MGCMPSRAYRQGGRTLSRVSFSLFAAVFLLISTSLAAGVADKLHRISVAQVHRTFSAKYLVLLVLDGAEPGYFSLGPLPHLDALRRNGVQYDRAWAGILESETPSGHAALSTGSTPARDGLLGFNWITSNNDTVHLFDPNIVRQGGIERVMQAAGAPTIASLFKGRHPKAKVVAVSGHKYYAADPLGGPKADYIMYYAPNSRNRYVPTAIPGHVPPASILNSRRLVWPGTSLPSGVEDRLATKLALTSFAKVHQRVTLINLPEFDWPLGHVHGGQTWYARRLMMSFDHDLGMIEDAYRRAGVLNQTVFVITADHGMAPLRYQIPDSLLDNAVTAAGTSSLETTYSTAGYVWLKNPSFAQQVAANAVKKNDPHVQSVYYEVGSGNNRRYVRAGGHKISSAASAANQYLLGSFNGGNAPDVVAFCTEDAAFVTKGAESWKGNHGGAAWQSQHIPLIISGPGVLHGVVSHSAARLEDIAPTALALFGIRSTGMQGTVLADALANPGKAQRTAESKLERILAPLVVGLQGQSQQEVHSR